MKVIISIVEREAMKRLDNHSLESFNDWLVIDGFEVLHPGIKKAIIAKLDAL